MNESSGEVRVVVSVPYIVRTNEEYEAWADTLYKARDIARKAVASGLSIQQASELAVEYFTDKGIIGWSHNDLEANTEGVSSKLASEAAE